MLARITKSTACRPRNTEGERFVTIPSRGPFPFFHSRRSSLGSANEHARHAGASIDFDNLRQGPFDSVHFQREIRLSHTRPFRHQTAMWSFRRKHDTKLPVEYEAPTHRPIRTVSIREVHRHGPYQSRDPIKHAKRSHQRKTATGNPTASRTYRTVDMPIRIRSADLPRSHGKHVFAGTHRQAHADPGSSLETGIHEIQYQYPVTGPDRLQTLNLGKNTRIIGVLTIRSIP